MRIETLAKLAARVRIACRMSAVPGRTQCRPGSPASRSGRRACRQHPRDRSEAPRYHRDATPRLATLGSRTSMLTATVGAGGFVGRSVGNLLHARQATTDLARSVECAPADHRRQRPAFPIDASRCRLQGARRAGSLATACATVRGHASRPRGAVRSQVPWSWFLRSDPPRLRRCTAASRGRS